MIPYFSLRKIRVKQEQVFFPSPIPTIIFPPVAEQSSEQQARTVISLPANPAFLDALIEALVDRDQIGKFALFNPDGIPRERIIRFSPQKWFNNLAEPPGNYGGGDNMILPFHDILPYHDWGKTYDTYGYRVRMRRSISSTGAYNDTRIKFHFQFYGPTYRSVDMIYTTKDSFHEIINEEGLEEDHESVEEDVTELRNVAYFSKKYGVFQEDWLKSFLSYPYYGDGGKWIYPPHLKTNLRAWLYINSSPEKYFNPLFEYLYVDWSGLLINPKRKLYRIYGQQLDLTPQQKLAFTSIAGSPNTYESTANSLKFDITTPTVLSKDRFLKVYLLKTSKDLVRTDRELLPDSLQYTAKKYNLEFV